MAKFIVPYSGELRMEAESVEEAREKANAWRTFVMQCVHGRLEELGLEKVTAKPMPEVTQVDDAWLENQRLRSKFRVDWEYTSHQVPIVSGSKTFYTHRIAVGPAPQQENVSGQPRSQSTGEK